MPRIRNEKLLLPVKFNDAELQAIGLQLAAKHQEIGRLEVARKLSADRAKKEIETVTAEASNLARQRVNGYEDRYVDCETSYDFKKQTRRTVRMDTKEVVSEGPMTEDEMKLAQMAFDDAKEASKEAK